MSLSLQVARALLFAPGDVPRRMKKALASKADVVILDLEDAVPEQGKDEARAGVVALLRERGNAAAGPAVLVRVNAWTTPAGVADLRALARAPLDGIVLPKADPEALAALPADVPPVIALIETAAGLVDCRVVAADARVVRLQLGAIDLCLDLGLRPLPGAEHLLHARSQLVVASAVAGLPGPIDAIFEDVHDVQALERETRHAAALGMRGKACIHPVQIDAVGRGFAPTPTELEEARAVVAAFDTADGVGAVVVDGRMVDRPLVELARRTLSDHQPME